MMNKANCDPAKSPKGGVETLAVKSVAGVLTPDHGLCVLYTAHTGRVHAGVTPLSWLDYGSRWPVG